MKTITALALCATLAALLLMPGCDDFHPRTPLAVAAAHDDLPALQARIEELLREGGEIDAMDELGNTAALWAARRDAPRALRLLLDAGADIDQVDGRSEQGWTLLATAAHTGSAGVASALVEWGAAVDKGSAAHGNTPLILLIESNAWEDKRPFAEALLAAGADPGLADHDGNDPLTLALARGESGIVEALLAVDPELRLTDGALGTFARTLAWLRGDGDLVDRIDGE